MDDRLTEESESAGGVSDQVNRSAVEALGFLTGVLLLLLFAIVVVVDDLSVSNSKRRRFKCLFVSSVIDGWTNFFENVDSNHLTSFTFPTIYIIV